LLATAQLFDELPVAGSVVDVLLLDAHVLVVINGCAEYVDP
jgi:hypothetical protein